MPTHDSQESDKLLQQEAREKLLNLCGLHENNKDTFLEELSRKAEERFKVPIAFVSFGAPKPSAAIPFRQEKEQVHKIISLYQQTFLTEHAVYITDAATDPGLIQSPLFQNTLGIRFFAIAAIVIPDGLIMGALCLLDTLPRPPLSDQEQLWLQEMATSASAYIQCIADKNT